jgi:hypothetical protein
MVLILARFYALLQLAIQVFLCSDAKRPAEALVLVDLQQSCIASPQHFQARQDLYNKGSFEHVETHLLSGLLFLTHSASATANPIPTKGDHLQPGLCAFGYLAPG